jgi:hypothetical protein
MLSHPILRPRAALLGAVALAAVAAPTADAAMPRMQQADFMVSATATQTTTWKRGPQASVADCSPIVRFSGEGRETVSMTLKPWRFTAFRIGRQLSIVAAPGKAGLGPHAWTKVSRTGVERSEEVAGTCMGNPGRVIDGGPYDCGTRNRFLSPQVGWRGGRLTLGASEAPLAPLNAGEYRTCPIHVADGVEANGLTPIGSLSRVPVGELLDPGLRQHVVLARRTLRLNRDGRSGTTTVRWTLTLTRKGPVR